MSECVSERCVFKYWQMNGRANHARSLKMINLPKWVKVVFSECVIESNRINSNWWGCCCCCGDFSFILFSDAISSNSRPNGSKRKSRTTCVLHEICILAIQRLGSWFFPYLFKWASTATQSKAKQCWMAEKTIPNENEDAAKNNINKEQTLKFWCGQMFDDVLSR